MRKCRPSKWVPWALVGVGLPLLAATLISGPGLKSDLQGRLQKALAADESLKFANIALDGRDAVVTGTSNSKKALEAAIQTVAGTYGIRTVSNNAVYEPLKLAAPTIESVTAATATPEIKGTWPEGVAKLLSVTVNGTTYSLPGSPELTSSGGNWLLKLTQPLPDGAYDVTATASDGEEATQAAEAPGKLVVQAAPPPDTVPPELPQLNAPAAGAVWPYALTGTFPEADTAKFAAKLNGQDYVLGQAPELTSDGKGNFSFAPTVKLDPGTYSVDFSLSDAAGNVSTFTAKDAIVVPAAEAAPAAAPEPAKDITPPAAPAISTVVADGAANGSIEGTWPEGDATKLAAAFQGRTYALDTDAELVRKGGAAGTFVFTPDVSALAPGKYSVGLITTDAAGNSRAAVASDAIVILPPPTPAKAVEPAPAPAPTPAPEPAAEPAPAAPLALPTVTAQVDLTGAPIIKGTWPEGQATKLAVTVGKSTYRLGTDANLRSDGKGNWTLLPSAGLADGKYNVVATASSADRSVSDAAADDLVVDATPPAAPTVDTVSSNDAVTALAGTYDAAHTKALSVEVPPLKLKADLGAAGSPLAADGAGKWTLTLPSSLQPGTYDLMVTATDARGRSVTDASKDEVQVVAKDQPLPKTDLPYDCAMVMDRIGAVFPMRFIYAKVDFDERFGTSVGQYAALLKDQRCTSLKLEVAGHADERGSDDYNLGLAERRAARVRDMLVEAGIDTARLSVKSYGESQPLDPASTEEAWAKNRRVELKILR